MKQYSEKDVHKLCAFVLGKLAFQYDMKDQLENFGLDETYSRLMIKLDNLGDSDYEFEQKLKRELDSIFKKH